MMSPRIFGTLASAVALLASGTPGSSAPHTPRYVLRTLAFPSGMTLPKRDTVRPLELTFALAANGAVAAIGAGSANGAVKQAHIVVWRVDGTRPVIGLPSQTVLARAFRHAVTNTAMHFPVANFDHVVLANDGTPFTTVSSGFSGAYSGEDKGIFRWTGTRWTIVAASGHAGEPPPPDYDVAAAELPNLRVAMTRDYSSWTFNFDAEVRDPNYQADEAWILAGAEPHRLGFGDVRSLAGAFACGYVSYAYRHAVPQQPDRARLQPIALVWKNDHLTRLGPGVAFGVNVNGAVVGDDRTTLDGVTSPGSGLAGPIDGVPTLWSAGAKTRLADRTGTAYSVSDDGTIVGTFAGARGFVVRGGALHELDATIVGGLHGRVIAGAYAINAHGRILVMTAGHGGLGLGVLDLVP
jgi:hypothetical protein